MTMAVIFALLALSGWLGMKLMAASKENGELRSRVESLKRQLLRLR